MFTLQTSEATELFNIIASEIRESTFDMVQMATAGRMYHVYRNTLSMKYNAKMWYLSRKVGGNRPI